MKWNNNTIDEYINNNNFNIKRLSDYNSIDEKMEFQCACGNIYYTSWHNVKDKRSPKIRCDICGNKLKGQFKKITIRDINGFLKDNNYTCVLVSNEIKNTDEKLTFRCECGNLFFSTFGNFKKIKPYCKSCRKKYNDLTYFNKTKNEIENKLGNEYKLLEYKNQKLYIHCIECNNIFSVRIDHFNEGQRCPICSRNSFYSNGEKNIRKYLDKYKINYICQYKFDDCKDIRCLPFDFYLPDYNMCIEFDGEQHYKVIDHFGGKDAYKIRVKHDKIKSEYCRNHNIKLLRILYSDIDNIENIINISLNREEVV